jgi:hypothetical protein
MTDCVPAVRWTVYLWRYSVIRARSSVGDDDIHIPGRIYGLEHAATATRVNVVKCLSPVLDSNGRDMAENYFSTAKLISLPRLRSCYRSPYSSTTRSPVLLWAGSTLQLHTLYFSLTYAISIVSLKYALYTVSCVHSISRLPLQPPQLYSIDWSLGFL